MATIKFGGVVMTPTDRNNFKTEMTLLGAEDAATVTDTKPTPVDADKLVMLDSAATDNPVVVTKAQLLAALSGSLSALSGTVGGHTTTIGQHTTDIGNNTLALSSKQETLVNQSNIKSINGESILGAGNITVAGGGGADALGLWDFWSYIRFSTTGATAPDMFAGAAIASGTNTTVPPATGQAGFNSYGVFLRSGTTANGGYRYATTSITNDYFGAISHKFRFQFMWLSSFTGRTVRGGYHDTATSADAVDGAYFEILDNVVSAKTANNSVRTTNATTYTLSLNTPYTFDIDVDLSGTAARFRVYEGNNYTPVLDVTNTANIPLVVARAVGASVIATEASTTASDIGVLYGMGVGTVPGFAKLAGVYVPTTFAPDAFTAGMWTATLGDTQVVLDITSLPNDNGSAITALQYTTNGGGSWVTLSGTGTGSRTVTGLTNGTAYPFQIRAVNAIGNGAASDVKSRTPASSATAPAAFTSGQWTSTPGDTQAVINITALPADGGSAITALQYTLNGSSWTAFAGTGTGSRTITGLTNSTTYPIQIRAVNAIGNGAASDTKNTTPAAASGGLVIVQDAGRLVPSYGATGQQTITAPASGNSLLFTAQAATTDGAPTITDSAGGTWGTAIASQVMAGGSTVYWFVRNNVTDAPTWVRATYGVSTFMNVGTLELSGAGTGLTVDSMGVSAVDIQTTDWSYPFTSSVNNTLLIAVARLNGGRQAAGTPPLVSTTTLDDYSFYARGIFPTAGANTGTVTLNQSESGDKAWAVFRPGV